MPKVVAPDTSRPETHPCPSPASYPAILTDRTSAELTVGLDVDCAANIVFL